MVVRRDADPGTFVQNATTAHAAPVLTVARTERSWDVLSRDRLFTEVRETVMRLVRGEIKGAGSGTG